MKSYSYFSYTRVIAIISLMAGIILLWPGRLFFLNDDFIHLNLTSQGKWLQQNSFRPVCDLSMWIDYQLWGLNATGFHITNTLLHIANSYLVFRLSNKFLERYHQPATASSNAILIASVFFLYAFHAESIFWVIGRSSSLGVLFFLLSLVHYMERHRSQKRLFFSMLFFLIGLLTYESVWITPLVFFIISAMDIKSKTAAPAKERNGWFAVISILCTYFIVRYISIGQLVDNYEGDRFIRLDIKGLLINYLKLIVRSFSKQSADLYLIIPALLTGVTAFISFLLSRKNIIRWGLVLLWIISYLPYLSLGIDTFGTEGERYLYLPSIFLCLILGLGIVNAARVYKYVISLIFFLIHILLLYDARKNYELASAVTKATTKELQKVAADGHIYFMCLPMENKGALIFREGIRQATQLFSHPTSKITILSPCTGNFESFHGVSEEDPAVMKGKKDVQVLFDYSKNSLIVSYLPPGTISE